MISKSLLTIQVITVRILSKGHRFKNILFFFINLNLGCKLLVTHTKKLFLTMLQRFSISFTFRENEGHHFFKAWFKDSSGKITGALSCVNITFPFESHCLLDELFLTKKRPIDMSEKDIWYTSKYRSTKIIRTVRIKKNDIGVTKRDFFLESYDVLSG